MKHDYSAILMFIPLIGIFILFLKENGIFWIIKRSIDMKKWKKTNPEKYIEELEKDKVYYNLGFGTVGGTYIKDMDKFWQRPKVQAQIKAAQKCAKLQAQGIELDFSKCEIKPGIELYHEKKV